MSPQTEKVVKSLAGAIQEKFLVPTENRFQQMELRLGQLERRLRLFCASLSATVVLILLLTILGLLK